MWHAVCLTGRLYVYSNPNSRDVALCILNDVTGVRVDRRYSMEQALLQLQQLHTWPPLDLCYTQDIIDLSPLSVGSIKIIIVFRYQSECGLINMVNMQRYNMITGVAT